MPTLESYDLFSVGKTAQLIAADPRAQKKITNTHGGKVFYKTAPDVDSEDTELAVGSSVTVDAPNWIISASESGVLVEHVEGSTYQDLSVTDDAVVKGDIEIDGELNHDGTKVGFYGVTPDTRQEVKKSELTAGELATALAKTGIVKVEA